MASRIQWTELEQTLRDGEGQGGIVHRVARTLTLYMSISHDVAVYCLVVVVLVGFPSSSVSKASA